MKSDKVVYWSIVFVIIMMLVWTTVVIYSIGPDSVWAIISGKSKTQIESLGQLGASYGVLAALFAGLAVVMLIQSIKVQQKELTQLKKQMENDQLMREYTWLIDVFQSARNRISKYANNTTQDRITRLMNSAYTSHNDRILMSDAYIIEEADRFLELRAKGVFIGDNAIEEYRDYNLSSKFNAKNVLDPFDTYMSAIEQIASFIMRPKFIKNDSLLSMFASVTNLSDLIIIHEQSLLRDDTSLMQKIDDSGLLGAHGRELYKILKGGPRLKPSAFGIKK